MLPRQRENHNAGFTLAELLVSTVIASIVLGGLYMAYSSSIRLWHIGEANLQTYQDARTSMSVMAHELQNIVPGSIHLIEGSDDSIEFFSVLPSMDVEKTTHPQALWIKYRLKQGNAKKGDTLIREERVVESPLPSKPPKEGDMDKTVIKMGRNHEFELAEGVKSFGLHYYWVPPKVSNTHQDDGPPPPVDFIVNNKLAKGEGLPQGIELDLSLMDRNAPKGVTSFSTFAVFRGPSTQLKDDSLQKGGGGPGAN